VTPAERDAAARMPKDERKEEMSRPQQRCKTLTDP
jgi:hypothetical protein